MRPSIIVLSTLFALAVQAAPTPGDPDIEHPASDDDDVAFICPISADGVRYRTCPTADNDECPAVGQYPKGKEVGFTCYTTDLNNDSVFWNKTKYGYYVAGKYIPKWCSSHLKKCGT